MITLDEYKLYEGITTDKDGDKIQFIIDSASQLVKTFCGRTFVDYYSNNKIQKFNITQKGVNLIQLVEAPIVSIVSVEERITATSAYTTLVQDVDYYIDEASIYKITGNWEQGYGSVRITYKGGYAKLPSDLKLAVLDLVTFYYKDEYKQSRSIGTSSIQNYVGTTNSNAVHFPDHIRRVLNLYRYV